MPVLFAIENTFFVYLQQNNEGVNEQKEKLYLKLGEKKKRRNSE